MVLVTLEKRRYDCTMINVRISAITNATCHKNKKIILKHELLRMLISHLFQIRKMYAPWRNGRRLHLFIVVSNESNFIAVIYLFTQKYQMCWNLSRAKNNKCASTTCQHILSKYPVSFIHSNNVIFSMSIRCKKKNQEREKEGFCVSRLQRFS